MTSHLTSAQIPVRAPRMLALSVAAALGLGAVFTAPAWAHDTLIASTPEEGEVLDESPEDIVLEFSGFGLTVGDSITNEIQVSDEDKENWETETEVSGSTMSTELAGELPNGEYEVLYRVVYSDGHSEEMSFLFDVEVPSPEGDDDGEPGTSGNGASDDGASDNGALGDTGAADEEETTAPAAPDAEPTAAEETAAEASLEEDVATQAGQFPVWVVLAIGGGALALIAVVLLVVRGKLKQNEK